MATPVLDPVPPAALAAQPPDPAIEPPPGPAADALLRGSRALAGLPVELEVGVPIRNFRVRNLLALERGVIVEARWDHLQDVPLAAGKVQLAWSEFEVLDNTMAVRLTRLA